jgi:hypothetical protein
LTIIDDALVVDGAPTLMLGSGRPVHVEVVGERAGPQRRTDMHIPGQRRRAAIAADLGGGERVGLIVGAETAVLFGNRNAEQAGAMQILVVLGREFGVTVVSPGAAGERALAELARRGDDRGLFIGEPEGVGIEDRRVEGDFADRGRGLADLHRHLCRHFC